MPDTFNARRRCQRRLGYLIGAAMLVTGIAASGTAQAVVRAPQAAHARSSSVCVTKTGTTSSKPPSGSTLANGTEFTVYCPDPTLVRADRSDSYRGYLLVPPGRWVACHAWIKYPHSGGRNVLCRDVKFGTIMTVVAKMGGHVKIWVGS